LADSPQPKRIWIIADNNNGVKSACTLLIHAVLSALLIQRQLTCGRKLLHEEGTASIIAVALNGVKPIA
jgi:hypothetical protein